MTLLIVIAVLVLVAIVATVSRIATDGYHRVPTCSEGLHYYR